MQHERIHLDNLCDITEQLLDMPIPDEGENYSPNQNCHIYIIYFIALGDTQWVECMQAFSVSIRPLQFVISEKLKKM